MALVLILYGLFTMFFHPVEISQIEKNKLVSSDHKVLNDKVKVLEAQAEAFNNDSTKILTIVNKKTN